MRVREQKQEKEEMPSSWVEIDLEALRHNFTRVRERLAPGTLTSGVVKSDAYGHGMIPVARELAACGADFLAVSKFWEAKELREHGIGLPVLTLIGVDPEDMEEAVRLGVRPLIFRMDHAVQMSEAARRVGAVAPVHLKLDTGMGRLGIAIEDAPAFLDALTKLPGIRLEGVASHFSTADEADKNYSERQAAQIARMPEMFASRGMTPPIIHISNSAGALDLPGAHFQMVRPGIVLYGSHPSGELARPADLRPVMAFKSKILQLKEVSAGTCIGYGRTFATERTSRIATIPVGYDDGYPRLLSNRGQALICGKRAPVVGRVSMNMIMANVTHIPEAREDDEVALLGAQGEERITGEEIAKLCNTISYEIYCNIGKNRFKRFFNAT